MCIEIVNYFRQCNKFLQPTHFLSIAFGNRERYFDHRLIQFAVVVAEFAIINDAVSHGSVSLRVVVFKVLELLQKSLPLRFRKFGLANFASEFIFAVKTSYRVFSRRRPRKISRETLFLLQ